MFDHEQWRRSISERLVSFGRNPRETVQLSGTDSLLVYLAWVTSEPLLGAFHQEPIAVVQALAHITTSPGADHLLRRGMRAAYIPLAQLHADLRHSQTLRATFDAIFAELHIIGLARTRLNGVREEWLRTTLDRDLRAFPDEFPLTRRALADVEGQARALALRGLRTREGRFSPADIVLLREALGDAAAHIRASAARLLGTLATPPSPALTRTLLDVALRDPAAETRFAAARSLGAMRDHVATAATLDMLGRFLVDADGYTRSAAALVLGELGEHAGSHALVADLGALLDDPDPYTREAAARALGRIGLPAAHDSIIEGLVRLVQNGDVHAHEAALDSLQRLRGLRAEAPWLIRAVA